MPLDVTTGPSLAAAGSGPPGQALGPPPSSGGLPPFATLLAEQAPAAPTATLKAPLGANVVPETKDTDKPKDDDTTDEAILQSAVGTSPFDAAAMMNWMALAASQPPLPVPVQTVSFTADTAVSGNATSQNEVMDTAPVSAAPSAQTMGCELLPFPTSPQGAADTATSGVLTASDAPSRTASSESAAALLPAELPVPVPASSGQTVLASQVAAAAPSGVITTTIPVTPFASQKRSSPVLPQTAAAVPLVASDRPAAISISASPAPSMPLTDVAAAPVATDPAAVPQDETATAATLQNNPVPANNTGRTASSGAAEAPVLNATAPDGEAGDGRPAAVAASKAPVFSSENIAHGPTISRSSRRKETGGMGEADLSPPSTPLADDTHGAEAATLAALPTDIPASSDTSTGVTQKPLTGAERDQVVRQMAAGVAATKPHVVASGQGQMTLNLHPKEWGDLRVTVNLTPGQTDDGLKQTVVTAHVVASSPAVKAALETHTAELNRALHETGLRLERLTVTVQAASAGNPSESGQDSSRQPSDRWQAPSAQTGSGGIGAGGSSSFAAFSERQGGGASQSQSLSRPSYLSADRDDTVIMSVPDRQLGINAGFDRRA